MAEYNTYYTVGDIKYKNLSKDGFNSILSMQYGKLGISENDINSCESIDFKEIK